MPDARHWIDTLGLRPHPEGGHFRETYRAAEGIPRACLPPRFDDDRVYSTAIYFLLSGTEFSALHRIRQDEVWHHYDGSALTVHVLAPDGTYTALRLGKDTAAGEAPQAVVPAGHLFAATVDDPTSFTLAGCTVAPGFDFADFEMPRREELLRQYPQQEELIRRLTRDG
jgi:predicted cupin superfamily sugar epimerase